MKRGKDQPELFEILRASKSAAASEGDAGGSRVESLAEALPGPETLSTGARTFAVRYDMALVLLLVALVLLVVSYVLGVSAEQRRQEMLVRDRTPEEEGAADADVRNVWVVQVMSDGVVTPEVRARYDGARAALTNLGFADVRIHVGRGGIYLTVGRFTDRLDSELPALATRLGDLRLREGSRLGRPVIRPLAQIREAL